MKDIYKPTHILKKDFVAEEGLEVYKKGSYALIRKPHRKHIGFCCNVAFVTKNGNIRKNKTVGCLALFDKSFFKPLKVWFELIPTPINES
jgi:hypothetical protein